MTSAKNAPDFGEVVRILVEWANRHFEKERRMGAATRITGTARMKDAELIERLSQLEKHCTRLSDQFGCIGEFAGNGRNGEVEVSEAIRSTLADLASRARARLGDTRHLVGSTNSGDPARIEDGDLRKRLESLWYGLADLREDAEDALRLVAVELGRRPEGDPHLGDIVHLLTPEEAEAAFADLADVEQLPDGQRQAGSALVGDLLRLENGLLEGSSEISALTIGRFSAKPRRGRPTAARGREFSARLIGIAEGLGLKATRGRVSDPRSAVDAAEVALKCLGYGHSNHTVEAVLIEAPRQYSALEALAAASNPDKDGSTRLATSRRGGRVYGESKRGDL